jgi:hypothetical protein
MEKDNFVTGQLAQTIHDVATGCKPCAVMAIQCKYEPDVIALTSEENVLYHIVPSDGIWLELWLYKNPIMKNIIESSPRKATTVFEHWAMGKMFGYGTDEVLDFIDKLGVD